MRSRKSFTVFCALANAVSALDVLHLADGSADQRGYVSFTILTILILVIATRGTLPTSSAHIVSLLGTLPKRICCICLLIKSPKRQFSTAESG